MAKVKTNYTCTECGGVSNKWAGQCPACGQWNTLVETLVESGGGNRYSSTPQSLAQTAPVLSLADIEAIDVPRFGTGIEEFDRVLGGGQYLPAQEGALCKRRRVRFADRLARQALGGGCP